MDQFRTHINAPEFPFQISHADRLVMIGSCFAENMGERLQRHKLDALVNPFGILFNPFSIMSALERMLNDRPYREEELVLSGEHWCSLDHHGRFNHTDKNACLKHINDELHRGRAQLMDSQFLFVTLGSAWVYEFQANNHIVANCHKLPGKSLGKRLLSFQDTHLILRHIPEFLKSKGLDVQVVFTVSPVRHWKDGAAENQRSKSILNAAIHEVVDEFENCHYFPAYEFIMDDLRDYRFYANDMLHLTPQAEDYIWDKFQTSFLSEETRIICKEVASLIQAVEHRPMDPESNSFQRFVKKQLDLIKALEAKYKTLDLQREREHFEGYSLDA